MANVSGEKAEPQELYEADSEERKCVQIICAMKREAEEARLKRILQNDLNYAFYHGDWDASHKKVGQSKEFLPKQMMAIEQITSMMHQGLLDFGDWFSVAAAPGNKDPYFNESEARALMKKFLEDANFFTFTQDAIKSALMGSLMIAKVGVRQVAKPRYVVKRTKAAVGYTSSFEKKDRFEPQLDLSLVRPRDWFPDPTGDGLYQIQRIEMDYHKLVQIAEANPDDYDLEEIKRAGLTLSAPQDPTTLRRTLETGQTAASATSRMRVRLLEFWGTLVDERGNILHENCVATIANESYVIRRPQPNPYWHQKSPFVVAPLIRVPWSEWHKCLMDAPTMLNRASNELFNLILDSGLSSVFGIKQVRPHWILNADKLSGGLAPNDVISVNPSCPPGAKAVETVSSGEMSQEALQAMNMLSAEFNSASLTNDLRMGVLPSRSVKATEVVEASNSITGTFGGIDKALENNFIVKILELTWPTMMQHIDDFEQPEFKAVLGDDRALQVNRATPMKRFALTVSGHVFRVFGLTQTMNKIKDFKKLTTLLQTISSSPTLSDEFSKEYDFAKFLTQIMKSLDIDAEQIKLDGVSQLMAGMPGSGGGAPGGAPQAGPGAPPQGGPDQMSQTPQMASRPPEGAMQPGVGSSQAPGGGQ